MHLNIAIIEENTIRSGKLIDALMYYKGVKILHEVRSISQLISLVEVSSETRPDIVFIGVENSDIDFELELKKLQLICPKINVIHYGFSESEDDLLLKNLNKTTLEETLSPFQLLTEIAFFNLKQKARSFHSSSNYNHDIIFKIDELTQGEQDVAALISDGLTYVETAKRIGKSINTVRGRIKTMYKKLGIENGVQLANLFRVYNDFKIANTKKQFHNEI